MRSFVKKRILRYNFTNLTATHKWYYYFAYHRLFYGALIFRGRKAFAFKTLAAVKYSLKIRLHCDPIFFLLLVFLRLSPKVALFPIKKAGVVQGVPFPITKRGQMTFAIKFIVKKPIFNISYRQIF